MTKWCYEGSILTFSSYSIESPKEYSHERKSSVNTSQEKGEEDSPRAGVTDLGPLQVTFLAICFLQTLIITGGDDGHVTISLQICYL